VKVAVNARTCVSQPAKHRPRLFEFRRVFAGDVIDLFVSELLWRQAGRGACFTEEAVQAGGRHDPE